MKSRIKKEKKSIGERKRTQVTKEEELHQNEKQPEGIIVNKKEIYSILSGLNFEENFVMPKKNTLVTQNQSSLDSKFNDAGSGAVMEKVDSMIKEEAQGDGLTEKQNILRLILSDIQLCQFSEIFHIFSKEIESSETLDYFWRLKETLVSECPQRLINALIFLVWSLKFMKLDSAMISSRLKREPSNLVKNQEFAFTIQGQANFPEEKKSNGSKKKEESSSEASNDLASNISSPNFGMKLKQPIVSEVSNTNTMSNVTFNQVKKNSSLASGESYKSMSNMNTIQPQSSGMMPIQMCPGNSNYMNIPFPFSPQNAYMFPMSFYPGMQYMSAVTSLNPSSAKLESSVNTSIFQTEVIKSGQINSPENRSSNKQNTYDQFCSVNESQNNTLNSLVFNCSDNPKCVKKEHDYIDITVFSDKIKSEEEFDSVYNQIVSIFSKPLNDEVFIQLKKFMPAEQVKKLEEILKKNKSAYMEKKQYVLLFRNQDQELYLKIDPKINKYSITKRYNRGSKSKNKIKMNK